MHYAVNLFALLSLAACVASAAQPYWHEKRAFGQFTTTTTAAMPPATPQSTTASSYTCPIDDYRRAPTLVSSTSTSITCGYGFNSATQCVYTTVTTGTTAAGSMTSGPASCANSAVPVYAARQRRAAQKAAEHAARHPKVSENDITDNMRAMQQNRQYRRAARL